MKNKLKLENIIYVFVILCPILDIVSFIFRNTFNTKISPSTIIVFLYVQKGQSKLQSSLIRGELNIVVLKSLLFVS